MQNSFFMNSLHAAGLVFGALIILWAISLRVKDASLIDIFWGFGFLLVATACLLLSQDKNLYVKIITALPIIWGARLTIYLAKRNMVMGKIKDT